MKEWMWDSSRTVDWWCNYLRRDDTTPPNSESREEYSYDGVPQGWVSEAVELLCLICFLFTANRTALFTGKRWNGYLWRPECRTGRSAMTRPQKLGAPRLNVTLWLGHLGTLTHIYKAWLWCGQVTGMTEQNRQGHCTKETEILCMWTLEHANHTQKNPWR